MSILDNTINTTTDNIAKELTIQPQENQFRKSPIKYVILGLAALVMFGNNYAFDNPQALQKQIMKDVNITIPEYNLLYSVFSLPNVFLTFFSGFFIDLVGARICLVIFSFVITISQTIIAFGATNKLFSFMLIGRALFGISSENLIISVTVLISKWFKGSELAKANGIILTIPEIASAMNSFLSPIIYESFNHLAYPMMLSVCICIFSFLSALLLYCFETSDLEQQQHEEKIKLSDIKSLNKTFWILVSIASLSLGIYIGFMDDISDFYQEKFKFNSLQAGRLVMIPYLVSALISPFLGNWLDKIGQRRYFLAVNMIIFVVSQLLFASLHSGEEQTHHPNWLAVIPLILLGLIRVGYSFYSCVTIPSIQYVVDQKMMGTALGLLGTVESLILSIFPLLGAEIVVQSTYIENGFSLMSYFYSFVGFLGYVLCILLYFVNKEVSQTLDFVNPNQPAENEMLEKQDIDKNFIQYKVLNDDDED